jgi:hypothetical protein
MASRTSVRFVLAFIVEERITPNDTSVLRNLAGFLLWWALLCYLSRTEEEVEGTLLSHKTSWDLSAMGA